MDKILCICPLYNKIQFLPFSIGSVLNQEEVDVIMVIVDDCSTDGSYEWVIENTKGFSNVHIIRNEQNVGCYQSRNRGLKYAIDNNIEFDYYVVTDPDDQQFPNRFKIIIDGFKGAPNFVALKQPYYRINIDTKEMIEKSDAGEGAAIFKREVFDLVGYWDNTLRFGGDTEYTYRLGNYYHKSGVDYNQKVGKWSHPLLYAMIDDSGQNLTTLYPTDSPERQAVFHYINGFTQYGQVKDCYYDFNNTGHSYPSVGAPS